jgi:L-lactate utilization protein LutB
MHPAKTWYLEAITKQTAKALTANGFEAICVADAAAARQTVLGLIPKEATVGFGGSMTLREIGLIEALEAGGYKLINSPTRPLPDDKAQRDAIRRQAIQAHVFLASSNAVTIDGQIVSTDGTGTRVAAFIYGPRHVILVVGANKIVPDRCAAEQRIRWVAAPINARRLECRVPCTETGICDDSRCQLPGRICNAIVILHKKPNGIDRFTIVLVAEELGF